MNVAFTCGRETDWAIEVREEENDRGRLWNLIEKGRGRNLGTEIETKAN